MKEERKRLAHVREVKKFDFNEITFNSCEVRKTNNSALQVIAEKIEDLSPLVVSLEQCQLQGRSTLGHLNLIFL